MMETLPELAKRVHAANIKWWQDPITKLPIKRNPGELLMLIITELAEACEGERKDLMDDKLPERKMAEVEMADAFIRILDFAEGFDFELTYMPPPEGNSKTPDNKAHALLNICGIILAHAERRSAYYLSLAIAYIKDYCYKFNYDLEGAFEAKMKYNAIREDHTHEARLIAGGKQF